MYTGYTLRTHLHLKKSQFHALRHLLLASAQMLTLECRLVTARFVPMAIAARLIMNW
jgi:hypothetical protein